MPELWQPTSRAALHEALSIRSPGGSQPAALSHEEDRDYSNKSRNK
jgi:hypothetical protein